MQFGFSDMENKRVIVVGAGIVGVAAALRLRRRGFAVTLIDRAGPGEATSFGNAGVISPSALVPVQYPGMLRQAPALLRDPDGPLSLDWRFVLRNAKWFAAYLRHGRAAAVRRVAAGLAALTRGALEEHRALAADTPAARWIRAEDYLYIYGRRAEFEAEAFSFQLRAEHGVEWREVAGGELRELEPDLSPAFNFAVALPGHGVVLNPGRLVRELAAAFAAAGGEVVRDDIRTVNPEKREVVGAAAARRYDALVVAAGPWSAELARQVGAPVPLLGERGYHVFFRAPGVRHRHAMKVSAGKIVATPMDGGLRVAGIVEFKPLAAPPDPRVVARLKRHAHRLFPSARLDDAGEWVGARPALPDSLPVIGPVPGHPEVLLAFGHHHIGLTTGPRTGKLIAQVIAGAAPELDLAPYSPGRFATGKVR